MEIFDAKLSMGIFLLFLATGFYSISVAPNSKYRFALNPYRVLYHRKYYLVFTHLFIHSDYVHLLFNALTFYFFSPQLEIVIGSARFLIVFLVSSLISSLPSIIKYKDDPNYYSLGASGAISGIVFSYILLFPFSRLYVFFVPIAIPAPIFAMLYLLYCYIASKNPNSNINHDAHFWGAISGLIITGLIIPNAFENFFLFLSQFLP